MMVNQRTSNSHFHQNGLNDLSKTISVGSVNDVISHVQKVKSVASDFLDPQEILIGSYLKKKSALNKHTHTTIDSSKTYSSDNNNHTRLKWLKYRENIYWCVLRRNQFSYYRTTDEREAVNVIPREKILTYRILSNSIGNKGSHILLMYTQDKTYTFKFLSNVQDDLSIVNKWTIALNQFLNKDFESENNSTGNSSKNAKQKFAKSNPDIEELEEIEERRKEEEEEEEEEEDFDDIVTINNKKSMPSQTIDPQGTELSVTKKATTQFETDPDKTFYETYDPNTKSHVIFSTLLFLHVKTRFNRTKWKHLKCELTNKALNIYSIKSNNLKKSFDLDTVIDCIEINKFKFALITINERIEFKALNAEEMIEWIVNFKSAVLIRTKYSSNRKLYS